MNCTNCGTDIPSDERFCRNCGREAVPLEPTIFAGSVMPPLLPAANVTERFVDPLTTQSIVTRKHTAQGWTPPTGQSPPPFADTPEHKSFLVPITVASVVIALVSIGALAYFIMSKDKDDGRVEIPQEKPQTSPSPAGTVPNASPSPTVQLSPTTTPTPTPKPTPNNEVPPGARAGYCNDTNVFVRSAPNLNARPVTKITKGQKLWIIATSTNYSTWNGINSNWSQVQLYNSSVRGWVFSPFISY